MSKEDSGPAFPETSGHFETTNGGQKQHIWEMGLTKREIASILLKQPDSGIDWLDDMIRKAKRDAIAGQAMQAIISTDNLRLSVYESAKARECNPDIVMAECAYSYVDAMLKEGQNKK